MSSNWEHFLRAAAILVGPGPVKQRLADAYLRHLREIDARALPAEVLPCFEEFSAAMHSAQATGGLNAVEVAVRKMSEQEAGRHAAEVLEMLVAMSGGESREAAAAQRQLRVVGSEDGDEDLPAFLNRA
ncbi:MAG: hypothetical protein WBO04_10220 [Steroidobacteraceae bacterium]